MKNNTPFQFLKPGSTIEWYGNVGVARSPFFNENRTRKEIFSWAFITHKSQTENTLKKIFELSKAHS